MLTNGGNSLARRKRGGPILMVGKPGTGRRKAIPMPEEPTSRLDSKLDSRQDSRRGSKQGGLPGTHIALPLGKGPGSPRARAIIIMPARSCIRIRSPHKASGLNTVRAAVSRRQVAELERRKLPAANLRKSP